MAGREGAAGVGRDREFSGQGELRQNDLRALLEKNFDVGILVCRLFLCLSKDAFTSKLTAALGSGRTGITGFRREPELFLEALEDLGVIDAVTLEVNRQPAWSDRIVDRLRTMRGSAISGQKRGRGLENVTEAVARAVFGEQYSARCTFVGNWNQTAKCDFTIPDRINPRILIEVKGYGATGSKMSDIIGDIDAIKNA